MKILNALILILGLTLCIGACANDCPIDIKDLTQNLTSIKDVSSVKNISLKDSNSEEPLLRYSILFNDGTIGILEQKNCAMYNLSASILVQEDFDVQVKSQQLSNLIKATEVWQKWLSKSSIENIIASELASKKAVATTSNSVSLNTQLSVPNESSDSSLTITTISSSGFPFEKIITFYLGVGSM